MFIETCKTFRASYGLIVNPFSAGTVFRRQNVWRRPILTSKDGPRTGKKYNKWPIT